MPSSLNLSLTDELLQFVDQHSGEGKMYANPSEFVTAILRQKMLQFESQKLGEAVFEGLQDLAHGRLTEFSGSVSKILKKARS